MSVGGDDDTIAGSDPSFPITDALPAREIVAGRYEIVRWIGSGGMGRVYEALDTELGERIALKVLRGGLSEQAIDRFRREVRLTRRIQHRNVARMFDIGEHRGDKFLTMELVDGEPLTHQLGAPLPWPRLSQLALQICAGLAAAHEAGVIHRDLKPDNILVERGTDRAILTDFGIARSMDDAGVTQLGAVVGTPRYMAPEQLAGHAVDARADLFSLGVILFELATGARPWAGNNAVALAVAQATTPARPLKARDVPPWFDELVGYCLDLEPARRPASASAVGTALAAGAIGSALAPQRLVTTERLPRTTLPPVVAPSPAPSASTTLAVLPFACGADDAYLADGLVEDLVDTLSGSPALRVRPAGIVRARDSGADSPLPLARPDGLASSGDPRELGRELAVDHVVVGSLRRTPNGLRVSARLVSVVDGFQIWARRIDCDDAGVLAAAENLCAGIADALSTRATGTTRPTDPRAVDLYLRARTELRRFWGGHALSAAALLEQALELSPGSVPIAGALAYASVQAWVLQGEPMLLPRARAALERGLATGHPEAFLASASLHLNTNDPVAAARDLATALVRAPMLAQAHETAGRILVEVGDTVAARHHFETAAALDPTRAHINHTDLARLDALEGRWAAAEERVRGVVADPDPSISQLGAVFQARLATWRRDRDAMLVYAQRFASRMGGNAGRLMEFLRDAVGNGVADPEAGRKLMTMFGGDGRPLRNQLIGMQLLAEIALVVGQEPLALDTLAAAEQIGLMDVVILDRCPLFDTVSDTARLREIRDRVATRAARVLHAFRALAT